MPGPPPPPPGGLPPMMPPPPPFFAPNKGGPDERGALLKSIQKGAKLKKTVTVDKSAPSIGKASNTGNSSSNSPSASYRSNNGTSGGASMPNGLNLGGIFAAGIPKLKPTGKQLGGSTNDVNNSSRNNVSRAPSTTPPAKSFNSLQDELKKQMANENRNLNRGPPPPTPSRSIHNAEADSTPTRPSYSRNGSSNGFTNTTTTPNSSSLHKKSSSNVNISSIESTINQAYNNNKPVISYGKPNLAPKPPALNGKPVAPPKKLLINGKAVSRAQSMRSPRSPSPQSPDNNNPDYNKFGTVRNISSSLNQTLGRSLNHLSQPKPKTQLLNGRPTAPPPSVPQSTPLPPSKLKAPSQAPPPPPNVIPQPPAQAPPPPPHRTGPQVPSRAPPPVPTTSAPPPPPRHSSIREAPPPIRRQASATSVSASDLNSRFTFHSQHEFPKPPPFRNVTKVYTSKQESNC